MRRGEFPRILAAAALIALGALGGSCTTPNPREIYAAIDVEDRLKFLTTYPDEHPTAREALARAERERAAREARVREIRERAESWRRERIRALASAPATGGETPTDSTTLAPSPLPSPSASSSPAPRNPDETSAFTGLPLRASIRRVRIEAIPTPSEPITGAIEPITLRAIGEWEDGREAELTSDVDWQVADRGAHVSGGKLSFGCVASDIAVRADFLGEAAGTRVFRVHRRLRALRLEPSGAATSVDEAGFYRFQLVAECDDGATSDVSCDADWNLADPRVETRGCGLVRVAAIGADGRRAEIQRRDARSELRGVPVRVTASYGGLTASATLPIPFPR